MSSRCFIFGVLLIASLLLSAVFIPQGVGAQSSLQSGFKKSIPRDGAGHVYTLPLSGSLSEETCPDCGGTRQVTCLVCGGTGSGGGGVSQFDGSYAGSCSGTVTSSHGSYLMSEPFAFTVSNGVITVTAPGNASGTVSASGSTSFSGSGSYVGADYISYYSCTGTGTFVVSAGIASASGTWSASMWGTRYLNGTEYVSGTGSGTWSATRYHSYDEIMSMLAEQLPEFSETVVDPSFAGGTPSTLSYNPDANVIQLNLSDHLKVTSSSDSFEVKTSVMTASGYTDWSKNPPSISTTSEISTEYWFCTEEGVFRCKVICQNLSTGEFREGVAYRIPYVGKVSVVGDSVTVEAVGMYTSVSWESLNKFSMVAGGKAGVVGSVNGGCGIYKDPEKGWGLMTDGGAEVELPHGAASWSGNMYMDLKPIAERVGTAAVEYLVEGGMWLADKMDKLIEVYQGCAKKFHDGVQKWHESVQSPVPPMPEEVRIAMDKICGEFTLDLYEILNTTPVSARYQAADLMVTLNEIVRDGDIQSKLAQALSAVEQTEDGFAGTWRVKSLSLFDDVDEAVNSIDEAIVLAESREPEILDNLREIRDKLTDVVGLLAGDMCYDARVAGGSAELITLADAAFNSGDYKTAYAYAFESAQEGGAPLEVLLGIPLAVVIIVVLMVPYLRMRKR